MSSKFVRGILSKLYECIISNQFVVIHGKQNEISMSWKQIFDEIRSRDWHNTKTCNCSYHEESLYEHLIRCAEICYEKAIDYKITDIKLLIKITLAGLLHDIGKIGTQKEGCSKDGFRYVSFKGHGIVGGMSIIRYWDKSITEIFELTEQDWGDISCCADHHMCTYFPQQITQNHKYFTGIFPDNVKILLQFLRFGDCLSRRPRLNNDKNETPQSIMIDVLTNTEEYENTLWNNTIEFEHIKKNGILIFLQGASGTGKTTFAKYLIDKFGQDISVWINRDLYMIQWVLKEENNKDIPTSIDKVTPELYQYCYNIYSSKKPESSLKINKKIKEDITNALSSGLIVILDTIASMFDAIYGIIPDLAVNSVRFAFWLTRNKLFTEEETLNRHGLSLNTQLSVHGNTNLYNYLHTNIRWYKNTSTLEGNDDKCTQSHISISLTWNKCKDHIMDHFISKIKEICSVSIQNRLPTLNETFNLNLIDLVKILWDYNGLTAIKQFFNNYDYNVSTPFPNVVGIKYRDGINRIWRPKWARQARGIFFHLSNEITILKYGLQRGIEILTAAHLEMGINETQDIDDKTFDILDDNQQKTMKTFSKISPVTDTILSAKVDGCLIILNVYQQDSKESKIINDLVNNGDNLFVKKIVNYCNKNNLPIWIPSSNGTLFILEDMQIYFLTSIESLLPDIKINSLDDLDHILPFITDLILEYWKETCELLKINPSLISFFFEAFCKDRTSFDGSVNKVLACSYEESGFLLFGAMYNNNYIPHSLLPYKIFKQPLFLNIESTETLFRLMKQLDNVVLGNITIEDFLINFEIGEFTSTTLHPEGFVLLIEYDLGYDYSKVKTELYYKAHKVKLGNIKELLSMPSNCSQYYPILKNLHNFYDKIEEKINNLVLLSYTKLVNDFSKDSVFYTKQNDKAKKTINKIIENKNINEMHIIYKMMLNNRSNFKDLEILFNPIINELYNINSSDMYNLIRNILMKIEPWLPEWELKIIKMIESKDDLIIKLYEIVVGF